MSTPQGAAAPPAAPQRPRRRGSWLLIAVATAVLVVLPGLTAAALFAIRHHGDRTAVWHRPLTLLRVSAPGANVTVLGGQPGLTQVEQRLTWYVGAAPRVREAWAGRTLTVTAARCGRKPPWHCVTELDIQVPAGVAVRAGAGDGSLSVTGIAGPVHAEVTSGQISLLGLHGAAWATASSGAISAASLTSPQVHAAVSSGSLALQFVLPPRGVPAPAPSGLVAVPVPPATGSRVAATTGSGNRGISPGLVSANSPRLITASSASGSASVGFAYGQPAPLKWRLRRTPRSPPVPGRPQAPPSHQPTG